MRRIKGQIIKAGFDFVLVTASTWVAFYLYFHGQMPFDGVLAQALTFATIYTGVSAFFGTNRTMWRYTSMEDLIDIVQAAVLTMFLFAVFQHFFVPEFIYEPTFAGVHGLVLIAFLTGQRLMRRVVHEGLLRKDNVTQGPLSRVLLVGAGDRADRFIKSVNYNPHYGYDIVGIVDNRRTVFGTMLHGVPILGKGKHLERILSELASVGKSPQRLVFTEMAEGTGGADLQDIPANILEKAEEFGLKLSQLPDPTSFREGLNANEGEAISLKPMAIEDLLGRPQAHIDLKSIRHLIAGKRVMVTGAGGSIGRELSRQIAMLDPAGMALIDFSEYNLYALEQELVDLGTSVPYRCMLCNVRVAENVERVFRDFKPQIVFHAAALKHVPLVELNPSEGVLTNVGGTRVIAEACLSHHVEAMVQISTDKAVNPCNVMGATKRLGEYLTQAYDLQNSPTRFVTVRFGNVLASSGSVVPLFRKQLERGGPLTVTHPDVTRYFMTIREAVSLVLEASSHAMRHRDDRGRILILDMGAPVKIVEVAKQMIRLAGLRPDTDIKIEFIGMRPGEKLYEELFDDREQKIATDSPSVMAAVSPPIDLEVLRRTVSNLEETARKGDDTGVVRILKTAVPGYEPAEQPARARSIG